jgi:serine/threonine-protein kinase
MAPLAARTSPRILKPTASMSDVPGELRRNAEARVGALLRDKWRVDQLLGIGGMAAVYAATHRNGKRAAIKILHAEAALVPEIRARFLREGYLANKVEHPGSVSILDDDVDVDGTVFLVMELLVGQTLESCREAGAIAAEDLLIVAYRALDVLAAAHARQIVHRDLKPANVFVCADGAVKILDYGIARLLDTHTPTGATGRDTALGTPGYMPPEQARGRWEEVDAQSDLWALGATLFAALTGHAVHQATTTNERLLAAMTLPAPALSDAAPGVSPELATLVDHALAFDKRARFPDAASMQAEVARVYEKVTGRSIAEAPALALATRQKSAHPGSPTLSVTNHAVSNPALRSVRPARSFGLSLVIAGALVLGLVALVLRSRRAPEARATERSAPTAAAAKPDTTVAAANAPPSVVAEAPSASVSATAPGPKAEPASIPKPRAGKKLPLQPPASATAASRTPAEPDPFTRRK